MKISIIIPVLNEEACIVAILGPLQYLRKKGHEIILVDGGSTDATVGRSAGMVDQVLESNRGRALQMNNGASRATGDLLLFLHADTLLPDAVDSILDDAVNADRVWGRFDVRLSGRHVLLRVIEWMMNVRSRLTGIVTGDQAIFITRRLFVQAGGYPLIPLMEDIAISKTLKQYGRPLCLHQQVTTSSRRWEEKGILRTIWKMWSLRLRYFLGADPGKLAGDYDR